MQSGTSIGTTLPPQSLLRSVRKKLGYAKYVCLDGGHRELRYKWYIARLNLRAGRTLKTLVRHQKITPIPTPSDAEVVFHSQCGHEHVTMGIWALLSVLRWFKGKAGLVIHSDGSITVDDMARFRRFFPDIRFVLPEDGRRWVERRFAGSEFDYLRAFRAHMFGAKLLQPHMSERGRTVVMMDTDIVFFRRPDELREMCFDSEGLELMSFRDDFDWASVMAPVEEIESCCGERLERGFNAGFVAMREFGDEQFRFLERMLRAYKPDWRSHYFAENALLALTAGRFGWRPLPGTYKIGLSECTPDTAAFHYVRNKSVRPRFFNEALPAIIRSLEESDTLGS